MLGIKCEIPIQVYLFIYLKQPIQLHSILLKKKIVLLIVKRLLGKPGLASGSANELALINTAGFNSIPARTAQGFERQR